MLAQCGIIGNNIRNNRKQYGEVQNRIIGRRMSIMSSGLAVTRDAVIPTSHREYEIGTIALLNTKAHGLVISSVHTEAISTDRSSTNAPNLKTLKFPNFESASHPARGANARNGTRGSKASLLYQPCCMFS